jgi:hypothetical protein
MLEAASVSARAKTGAFELRQHPIGGDFVGRRVGEPSLHAIGGEEEEIGAKLFLRDRLDLGRAPLLREDGEGGESAEGAEGEKGACYFSHVLVLTKTGIAPGVDDAELTALRQQFARDHVVRLPGLFGPELLAALRRRLEGAAFSRRVEKGIEIELTLEEPAPLAIAMVTLNDPALFALIDRMTGCGSIGCFSGRVHLRRRSADGGHYYPWHDDVGHDRLVGLSINLSAERFAGGVLEIRDRESERIVARVRNPTAGDAVLFRIAPTLEHHVTPVTTDAARLVLAGWFRRAPNFWDKALRPGDAGSAQA